MRPNTATVTKREFAGTGSQCSHRTVGTRTSEGRLSLGSVCSGQLHTKQHQAEASSSNCK